MIAFYIAGFAGLLIWNFLTSTKIEQCLSHTNGTYSENECQPSQLQFSSVYYTQPTALNASSRGSIGTYPWTPLGFGDGESDGPIDYSILTLPWKGEAMRCVMYIQELMLDLSNENSVISSCYYCGTQLRTICTTVDSMRTQVPDSSVNSYTKLLNNFTTLSGYAHDIADTAIPGVTVGSVRIHTTRAVPGLPVDVLPNGNSSTFTVSLGSSIGLVAISATDSNAGVSTVARTAAQLAALVEESTERDLQPSQSDTNGQQRTLQLQYLCKTCQKVWKPTLEIIALLITGVFGVLSPAFGLAKMFAEWRVSFHS